MDPKNTRSSSSKSATYIDGNCDMLDSQTSELKIFHPRQLDTLVSLCKIDRITVQVEEFVRTNTFGYAFKYALWALKTGGVLTIVGSKDKDQNHWRKDISFQILCYWIAKFCKGEGRITLMEPASKLIKITRNPSNHDSTWGAGIMFSGNPTELPQLRACIDGLLSQPELNLKTIYISGPANAGVLVADIGCNYVEFDDETNGTKQSFPISRKKNCLIASMKEDKLCILHSRIVLGKNCLESIPLRFDIGTPNIRRVSKRGLIPYLSFGTSSLYAPGLLPSGRPTTVRNTLHSNYRDLLKRGVPFVDGGVFCVRRAVWENCKLDDALHWGEFEDTDWCLRAAIDGYLVDMFEHASAISQVVKTPGLDDYPALIRKSAKFLHGRVLVGQGFIRQLGRTVKAMLTRP